MSPRINLVRREADLLDSVFFILLRIVVLAVLCEVSLAEEVHLSPDGDDRNDGKSRNAAVKSLERAWNIVNIERAVLEDAAITVWPGEYVGQSLMLTLDKPIRRPVRISGIVQDGARPVFRGDGSEKTWLIVRAENGIQTRLVIEGIEVRDYLTGISLEGNRDYAYAFNFGTVIRGNVFRRIGSIATNGKKRSTAAVRFVNSRDNRVEGNRFIDIRNKEGCGALHSIYAAHFSSGNVVSNNKFEGVCGSVIKLRDRANDNVIEGNQFERLDDVPAVEEWFCDMQARSDCTKKLGECPSTGNIFRNNRLFESTGSARMLSINGGMKQRNWCAREDFSVPRVYLDR